MKHLNILFILCMLTACSSSGSSSGSSGCTSSGQQSTHTANTSNVLPVTVGGNYINEITVSVTICVPGTATCQTIPNVLLDTGSNGLRLFTSVVSLSLPLQMVGSNQAAECVTYADRTSHWGPIEIADVTLGGETASSVPIQIIDGSFASTPTSCTNLEISPDATGYNGIVGVGLLTQDCGSTCVTNLDNQTYFTCSGSSCSSATMALNKQVTNPVSMMPTDKNGIILTLPSVGDGGQCAVSGTLTLGIGTSGNNTPAGGVVTYPADINLNFQTTFNNRTYSSSFIDSGSNALYFPATSSLSTCAISNGTFYCPSSKTTLTATQIGATGTSSTDVSFSISNALSILNSGNMAFSDFGGEMSTDFDWGLPFFLGRTIYVGIETQSSTLGTGPYWAY